jgi:hypothetical protein
MLKKQVAFDQEQFLATQGGRERTSPAATRSHRGKRHHHLRLAPSDPARGTRARTDGACAELQSRHPLALIGSPFRSSIVEPHAHTPGWRCCPSPEPGTNWPACTHCEPAVLTGTAQGHSSVSRWRQEKPLAPPPPTAGGRNLAKCVVQDRFRSPNRLAEIKQRLSNRPEGRAGRAKKCLTVSHKESFAS